MPAFVVNSMMIDDRLLDQEMPKSQQSQGLVNVTAQVKPVHLQMYPRKLYRSIFLLRFMFNAWI